jgi:hypothetical protein
VTAPTRRARRVGVRRVDQRAVVGLGIKAVPDAEIVDSLDQPGAEAFNGLSAMTKEDQAGSQCPAPASGAALAARSVSGVGWRGVTSCLSAH